VALWPLRAPELDAKSIWRYRESGLVAIAHVRTVCRRYHAGQAAVSAGRADRRGSSKTDWHTTVLEAWQLAASCDLERSDDGGTSR
jgi:hypothetical protein